MFYCYILQSEINGSYYVGSCQNIELRLSQHNKFLVPSTKRYAPWILIHKEGFSILKGARKRELEIKSWKRRSSIEKLTKTFQNFK